LSKTPGAPHAFTYADESETLGDSQASVHRALVGALLYLSHERPDIQFCAKSLSSLLKNPIVQAWHNLGRLIGYLKLHEDVSLGMFKGGCGTSLFGHLHGHTESECYSLVSCAIDTLYLKHMLEFMFPSKNVVATVYVDNSACRQIANKLGTGRLRHIQGKFLWDQHMTKSGQIKIKAVGTTWNPADLGTKTLPADRHRMLCYMLNMLLDGERMGEPQYLRATQADWNKQTIKQICNVSFSNSSSTPHVQHNIVKRVVQLVSLSNIGMTQGIVCTTCNVLVSQQALSQPPVHEYDLCLYGKMFMVLMIFAGVILSCGGLSATMYILDVTKVRPFSFCTHLLPTREDTATRICFTIVVVMNPELSKPYDPMHTSLVRN